MAEAPLFSKLTRAMQWNNRQLQVVSGNVARMDIPGEKTRELDAPSFKKVVQQGTMHRTHANHMSAPHAAASTRSHVKKGHAVSITGNNIDYQVELQKANEAATHQKQLTKIYGSFFQMNRTALGK